MPRTGRHGRVTYTAIYFDRRHRRRSAGTFTTERAANRAWQRAESDLAAGRLGDPRRGLQTLRTYVEEEWFPNHVIELSTRETYRNRLDLYILPGLGDLKLMDVLPSDVREWIATIQRPPYKASPATVHKSKVIVDAIFTTAFNDQIVPLHPGRGVRTPPVATKTRRILTADQYDRLHEALPDEVMRLLVETDIESGLRWGELTELRVKDLDMGTGVLTVSRAVVQLTAKDRPDGARFVIKDYPKGRKPRTLQLSPHLLEKLDEYIKAFCLGPDDLFFPMPAQTTTRRHRPEILPDPETLGRTEPDAKGRTYWHGTTSAYGPGKCRCQFCKDAVAAYRAQRRAAGKDTPRRIRAVDTDGHIGRNWFRNNIWEKALKDAGLGFHVTPHGLRHAHASWLLAGGADLQVVKERLGHASIATTEKYLHTLPGAGQAAIDALAAIRRPASPTPESTATPQRQAELAELNELRATVEKIKDLHKSLGLVP
jgi:integrase